MVIVFFSLSLPFPKGENHRLDGFFCPVRQLESWALWPVRILSLVSAIQTHSSGGHLNRLGEVGAAVSLFHYVSSTFIVLLRLETFHFSNSSLASQISGSVTWALCFMFSERTRDAVFTTIFLLPGTGRFFTC